MWMLIAAFVIAFILYFGHYRAKDYQERIKYRNIKKHKKSDGEIIIPFLNDNNHHDS